MKKLLLFVCLVLILALAIWIGFHLITDILPAFRGAVEETHTTGTEPSTTTSQTRPNPNSSNSDYLAEFFADHDAGRKITAVFAGNSFEISICSDSGTCTIIHREYYDTDQLAINQQLSCQLEETAPVQFTHYYRGKCYYPSESKILHCFFTSRYSQLTLPDSTRETVRAFVAKNLSGESDRAECRFWEDLLDGYITQDTWRCPDQLRLIQMQMEDFGTVTELAHLDADGFAYHRVEITDLVITDSDYYPDGSRTHREYDLQGTLVATRNYHADGTMVTREYIYENGTLVKLIVTTVHPDGETTCWEEAPNADGCAMPN